MSVIDDNSRGVGRTVQTDNPTNPISLAINPVTKKLRIEIVPRSLSAAIIPNRMPVDANSYNVAGTLDEDGVLTPLSVDLVQDTPLLRVEII